MKKVLVLSSAESVENVQINDDFVRQINDQANDYSIEWRHYRDISLQLSPDGLEAVLLPEKRSITDFDMVYFKSYYRYAEVAVALAEVLEAKNVPFICSELKNYISFSKLSQYARFARQALPIPATLYVPHGHLLDHYDYIIETLQSPFIMKASDGKGGDANFLVRDQSQFATIVADHLGVDFVLQSFVPNEYDLRLLVLNGKTELVIKRQRQDDTTHLNNTSKGAGASNVPVSDIADSVLDLAHQAANIMQREIAGVDIMFNSQTGNPVLLEVNASPQVASGALQAEKIDLYCKMFYNTLFKQR